MNPPAKPLNELNGTQKEDLFRHKVKINKLFLLGRRDRDGA